MSFNLDGFPAAPEKRVDSADGNLYTMAEFLQEYGNLDKWNAAGRTAPPVPAAAPPVDVPCMLFLRGLCPFSGASCPNGPHRAAEPAPASLAPAPVAPSTGMVSEEEAQRLVGALPPADRQAAIARVGGRQAWTTLPWVKRLEAARAVQNPAQVQEQVAQLAAQLGGVSFVEEKRIDPADGNAYTQSEFLSEYGPDGVLNWARAAPVGPAPVAVAIAAPPPPHPRGAAVWCWGAEFQKAAAQSTCTGKIC
eukprot:Hpha_TRINITY_DN2691_c0_g1::TRINITY_DN2691_c0_g1_i1::g.145908::m.145908